MTRNRAVLLAFSLVVGGVFVWAAALKIRDPLAFARDISNYRIVCDAIAVWVAIVLPWVEMATGLGLVVGLWRRTAALLASLMLLGFIVLVAVTMIRGLDVDCGCFGSLSRKAGPGLLLQDAVLLFMSVTVFASKADSLGTIGRRR